MPQSVSLFDVEPIYPLLEGGSLVLTPNQRLASRIRNAYVLASGERGQPVVKTPRVLSLSAWIEQQWQSLLANAHPVALDHQLMLPHQELLQWQQIVSATAVGQAILRPAATAQQASSAYRMVVEWCLDLQSEPLRTLCHSLDDARVWLQWADSFEQRRREFGLLPAARIPEAIIEARGEEALPTESGLLLVGFQDISPLHRQLLEASGRPEYYEAPARASVVNRVQCDSWEEEVRAAAVWSKQILKNDPAARVAIVIPELNQQRGRVERLVTEVFEPGYNRAARATAGEVPEPLLRRASPFNISAGYPLSDAPVMQTAFGYLALSMPTVELETVEALCHSPFGLLTADDADRAALLLAACRRLHCYQFSTATLRQLATDIAVGSSEDAWDFSEALQRAASHARQQRIDHSKSRREWICFFADYLQILGWPGRRRLDSIEYQQVMQWRKTQEQFVALDCVSSEAAITLRQAIAELRAVLGQQVFQPQTADSSLQLLGTLEAAGLQFSHLWLTSMSASQWPPVPRPNPLLPLTLQKQQAMPHSSAEREYDYARRLSQQFARSADRVIVSAPKTIDDNPVHFSPLFAEYPHVTLQQILGRELQSLVPAAEIRRRYLESRSTESVTPGSAPALMAEESIGGGSGLFADQSACPFRAFAKRRLHIDTLEQPQLGLSAAERGSVLHRALELFWNGVGSRAALLQMDDDQLRERCRQAGHYAVSQLLARSGGNSVGNFGARFLDIETQRLEDLLVRWMDQEKKRANFTVAATEQRSETRFAGLDIVTRIDRIDRLDDGSLLIIDYKTGRASIGDWWGDRPDQPQLPLYMLLAEKHVDGEPEEVSGIAYANVSADSCRLSGAGAEDGPESGISWNSRMKNDSRQFSWAQQKQRWQVVLTRLAEEFVQGCADIDPKHHPDRNPKTCQYCGLQSLCRISHEEPQ